MKTTPRDQVLMMILPAMIIVLGYTMFPTYGGLARQRMLWRLSDSVKMAVDKQPTQAQLQTQQLTQAATQRELSKVQAELKSWDDRWHAVTGPCLAHDRRSYRQSKLLTLLQEQKIHVRVHGPLESANDQKIKMKLSPMQDRLVKLMAERGGQQTPHLWRLQVDGGYTDVTRALRVLSTTSGELVAIPLSLVMEESKTRGSARSWCILVWI